MWHGKHRPADLGGAEGAQVWLGPGLRLKGEISGSEDLYIAGEVEGKIELEGKSLTVGPTGKVNAEVTAESVTILGRLQGKVQARERMEIRACGSMEGELVTARMVVEDGAVLRGRIEIVRPGQDERELKGKRKSVASERAAPSAAKQRTAGL